MHLFRRLRPARIAVGVTGQDLLVAVKQNVVHPPCIDGEAFDLPALRDRRGDAALHVPEQFLHVPDEVPVLHFAAVGEAVHLFGDQLSPFDAPDDVPAAARAYVDGKILFHNAPLFFPLL